MRTNASYRVVWNRKGEELKPEDTSLVQIEILFTQRNKKMYLNTGFRVALKQWDKDSRSIVNHPNAVKWNHRIRQTIDKIQTYELRLSEIDQELTREAVRDILTNKTTQDTSISFIAFCRQQIKDRRKEITGTTYALHNRVIDRLEKLGIITFQQLTFQNIQRFNNSLEMAQTTKKKQHDVIKHYLRIAENFEPPLHDPAKNPYRKFQVPRGKHKLRTRLMDAEMDLMQTKELQDPKLNYHRILYVFTMFTGLSHRDLDFKFDQLMDYGGRMELQGLRKKNDETYSIPIVPPARKIIEKYGRQVPGQPVFQVPSYEDYKRTLKIVAAAIGISKNITPHTGRHTCGSWLSRKGVPLKAIQRILGQVDLRSTSGYTELDDPTAGDEMIKAYETFTKKN